MATLVDKFDELKEFLQQKHEENIERLTKLETNQQHLDECLDSLKRKVSSLEKWIWRTTGGMAVVLVIVNLIVALRK
jgi:hypothetical protein